MSPFFRIPPSQFGTTEALADHLSKRRSLFEAIGDGRKPPETEPSTPGLPVLLYHKIGALRLKAARRGLYVSPRSFRAQLRGLRLAGFGPSEQSGPKRAADGDPIAITFDDGFTSALTHGVPALAEHGFRAINFLVAGRLGQTNAWDLPDGECSEPLMDPAQVRDWLAAGHEIGAHSLTHPHLICLTVAAAREEITAGKKSLEDLFSRPITDFAYPYGEFNPTIRDLVAEAGFERAWTVEPHVVTASSDPLTLPRIPVVLSLRKPLNFLRSLLP